VEERPLRVGSFVEWVAAAVAVLALIWLISVPVQRMLGPRVEATLDAPAALPPGVPAGAANVPVMLLLDGREIRHGELHTRAYSVAGVKFYVVCERMEQGGPLRVSGVYLP
jgi:hypothetical protein